MSIWGSTGNDKKNDRRGIVFLSPAAAPKSTETSSCVALLYSLFHLPPLATSTAGEYNGADDECAGEFRHVCA